jgi:hypothetical protein
MAEQSPSKRGIDYEKKMARCHNGKHLGGPGKPDYVRGGVYGEVKCRSSKMTKPELQRAINHKMISEVVSKSGYTKPAIEYRDRYHPNVSLYHRGKKI